MIFSLLSDYLVNLVGEETIYGMPWCLDIFAETLPLGKMAIPLDVISDWLKNDNITF